MIQSTLRTPQVDRYLVGIQANKVINRVVEVLDYYRKTPMQFFDINVNSDDVFI